MSKFEFDVSVTLVATHVMVEAATEAEAEDILRESLPGYATIKLPNGDSFEMDYGDAWVEGY